MDYPGERSHCYHQIIWLITFCLGIVFVKSSRWSFGENK